MTRTRTLTLFLIAVLALAACSSGSAEESSAAPTTTTEVTETPETTAPETTTTEAATTTTPETTPTEAAADPFDEVTAAVDAFLVEAELEGAGLVVVEADAGVVYENYFGNFDAERVSLIASSSKMISAGVLLKLQEDGLIDIDAPISDQVEWATSESGITVAQLLSNSSGLVGLGPNPLFAPYLCQWGVVDEIEACGARVFNATDDDAEQIAPDTEFRYGGAQWQVAGAIAETVSGKTWAELIDEIYVQPCGVDSLGYISLGAVLQGAAGYPVVFGGDPDSVTASDNPSIEGGAYSNTTDYAELLLMHLRGGECEGGQVLSQASLDTMHGDRIADAYNGNAGDASTGYGMGWWVDRSTDRISDGGAWGASPWLDLDDGYGAYLIIEEESSTGSRLKSILEPLVHAAVVG